MNWRNMRVKTVTSGRDWSDYLAIKTKGYSDSAVTLCCIFSLVWSTGPLPPKKHKSGHVKLMAALRLNPGC